MFYLFILPGECRLPHHQANSGGGGGGGNEAAQSRQKTRCSAGCSGAPIGAGETNTSQGAAIDQPAIFFPSPTASPSHSFSFFAYFCRRAKKQKAAAPAKEKPQWHLAAFFKLKVTFHLQHYKNK